MCCNPPSTEINGVCLYTTGGSDVITSVGNGFRSQSAKSQRFLFQLSPLHQQMLNKSVLATLKFKYPPPPVLAVE